MTQETVDEGPENPSNVLQLDVTAEGARALHRVVRAMHDGHCPRCGHIGPAFTFECWVDPITGIKQSLAGDGECAHECPECRFFISVAEGKAALDAFRPHFQKSLEVFERWRNGLTI